MTGVVAGNNEGFESLLRRFNKKVEQDAVLAEVRHRGYFEKPSVKRQRKAADQRRQIARALPR